MALQVVPYTEDRRDAVRAFNRRMEAGGVHWRWYESPVDAWLPERGAGTTWREHYLAVDDDGEVRGGYALRVQEWRVRGKPMRVADWQGPITEAAYDRRYGTLGLRLLREMLRQHPLLYTWGHGGLEQPLLLMLETLGWTRHATPFCLRIFAPTRFARRNRYLRGSRSRRLALDLLAFSGLAELGVRALHALLVARRRRSAHAEAAEFERFGAWADELWERCAPCYTALSTRDAATMNTVVRPGGWPAGIKLRVSRGGQTLGWAVVMDTRMSADPRFGELRVGSLVDALAAPADAEAVVGAALRFLRARGVDLVMSNQSHPAWIDAFAAHGFLILPDRRVFAASPELRRALDPFEEASQGLHLTNMDGHGPMRL